jgi:hypothetical protein
MKLIIHTVAEKTPPVGETVFIWDIGSGGTIGGLRVATAKIAVTEEADIRFHQGLIWSRESGAYGMRLSDHWSYSVTSNGN